MSAPTITKGQIAICSTNSSTESDWHVYTPKSISITYESLASADSGRSDNGTMHISWVRPKIRKFTITMPPLYDTQIADITYNPLLMIQGQTYYIKAYDVTCTERSTGGTYQIFQVYTSNTQAECYSGVIMNGMWQGIQFSAIEV